MAYVIKEWSLKRKNDEWIFIQKNSDNDIDDFPVSKQDASIRHGELITNCTEYL